MKSENLVEVHNLTVAFAGKASAARKVVDDISFEIREGEVLGVLGESGSGKTMTTQAILGIIDGQPGVIDGQILTRFRGEESDLLEGPLKGFQRGSCTQVKDLKRWHKDVGHVMSNYWGGFVTAIFQHPRASLDPLERIGQQVTESIALAHPALSKSELEKQALHWLERVQLTNPERVFNSYPHELSGGMCQRAMIAVAVAREPQLLIADEPTTGLDSTVRAEIVELFRFLLEDRKRAMLYISHDIREVLYLADRVVIMRHGKILETVSAEDLHRNIGERHEYTKLLMSASSMAFRD